MRIDKYLWCIRLTKTRTLASAMCERGHVRLNGMETKSSKEVKAGDTLDLKVNPIWRTFTVCDTPVSRLSAKLVIDYLKETTPAEELEKLSLLKKMIAQNHMQNTKGRPTKKDRRNLDEFYKK